MMPFSLKDLRGNYMERAEREVKFNKTNKKIK